MFGFRDKVLPSLPIRSPQHLQIRKLINSLSDPKLLSFVSEEAPKEVPKCNTKEQRNLSKICEINCRAGSRSLTRDFRQRQKCGNEWMPRRLFSRPPVRRFFETAWSPDRRQRVPPSRF